MKSKSKKRKRGEAESQEGRKKLCWSHKTMKAEKRTLTQIIEQSNKAKNNPGIDPRTNYGQKGKKMS